MSNYRLAYLQQINPKDIAQVIQEFIKRDSNNQYQAAVLQAALEAHLRKDKKAK